MDSILKTTTTAIAMLALAGSATASDAGCYYSGDPVVNPDGTVETVEFGASDCYYGGDPVITQNERDIPEVLTEGYAVYEGDPEHCDETTQMITARR